MINTFDFRESYRWSVDPDATADALVRARQNAGMSRNDVLNVMDMAGVNISYTSLSNWETGRRVITLDHAFLLAAIYRVSLDQLVIGYEGFRPGAEVAEDPADPLFLNFIEQHITHIYS